MFKYLGVVDGRHTAVISDDNLQISWLGETGPNWDELYMEKYHNEFLSALSDYTALAKFNLELPK
jgi:hypothetical protein